MNDRLNMTGYSSYPMNNYPVNNYHSTIQTNIIRVTGLDEAIMRNANPGSEMLYVHQDKDEFYIVKVDFDGRKTWATFNFTVPNADATVPATRADLTDILKRLDELELKLNGGADNGKPTRQSDV